MFFLTWAASILPQNSRARRARRRRPLAAVDRLAHVLFHRTTGPAGNLARLGLLALVAVLSYFIGAGVGAVIMKAPVPAALIVSALLIGWAGDPDTN